MRLLPTIAILSLILPLAAGCRGEDVVTPEPPAPQTKEDVAVRLGDVNLVLHWKEDVGYTPEIAFGARAVIPYEDRPVNLELFPKDLGSSRFYKAGYSEAVSESGAVVCVSEIKTDAGSVFKVRDTYSAGLGTAVRIARTVEVENASAEDHAYNSYLMLREREEARPSAYEFFMPSLIYGSSEGLSSGAVGADFSDDWILAREERMGLPLAMMRRGGVSVALSDVNSDPSTVNHDFGLSHLVDSRMKFGSLGFFLRPGFLVLTYCYPGSEGERTYADGATVAKKRWARRSHPVAVGSDQGYSLELQFSDKDRFPEAMRDHWQRTFDLYSPSVLAVSDAAVVDASLEVLDAYWMEDAGAPGWPFSVHLPSGLVHEVSYDMGFVGMQVACGYYLYRAGLEKGRPDWTVKGEAVMDWWASNSLNESGMPRVWWDISPWNLWRNSNDLRNMQGGQEAMLLAWRQAEKYHPGTKETWLQYCTRAADWLLSQQHEDGSWDKAFDNGGTPVDSGRLLTSNPIRFLTYLYESLPDPRYKEAALKAGAFCLDQIHTPYRYIGSVIDNPYVLDRESGQKALEAFLSLYEITREERWLDAAVQAAYYTATYMYAWNIPPPEGNTNMAWDRKKSSVGITIIATGHSGADAGLAYNAYEYFRLYHLTRDPYFLRIAEILEKDTKQTMDYDGSLGYAFRGLQTEALRLVTHWGDHVNLWLPWLTAANLDPLYKLQDMYGQMEIRQIDLDRP